MSVQFGRWNFDGKPIAPEYIEKVNATLAPYGPDSSDSYSGGGVQILYRAFHTTNESRREVQPLITPSGAVITWDGRLDNRDDLIGELSGIRSSNLTDVEIISALFEQWGDKCLAKLVGDWALCIWNPTNRSLILAKDPIGARHLHYVAEKDHVAWSTIPDPLVLLAGRSFELCEEYVAGWFSSYPAPHLTAYVGISSVPPSSSVVFRHGGHKVSKYWDFDPEKRVRYRSDAEYEEHFRSVFAKAVRRRLHSDSPVLAELSGGRDSSSIVCMADTILAEGQAECPRVDTVSYYDDSEPNWNERPYFAKVEEKRGRTGWHIGPQQSEEKTDPEPIAESAAERFVPAPNYPGYDGRTSPQIGACLTALGNRVLLSGIGGDEVMGGVPTPTPELADLLSRARLGALAHQLKIWALEKRVPWFHLFWEAAREFLPSDALGVSRQKRPAAWLRPRFVKRHRAALQSYPVRAKLFGPLPSFQGNLYTLDGMRRQLTQVALPFAPHFEKRYPYLDRDLLEFMFAVPREQLLRPTHRRSLMRRALTGIVPDEILNRKTKAFVARAPMVAVTRDWPKLAEMSQNMACEALGIVDSVRFTEFLHKAKRGEEAPMFALRRTMLIEGWVKHLRASEIISLGTKTRPTLAWQTSAQG